MPEMIQINFSRDFPLFPLAGVCLLPHATIPLHIFESRYVKMIGDSLDGSGQIALASFEGDQWKQEYHGNPPVRPVVCLGQIERHERLPLNRYQILLQGICRAQLVEESAPDPPDHPYRRARLAPLEQDPSAAEPALAGWRSRMRELLAQEELQKLRFQSSVLEWFDKDDIPSYVLVEIVGHLLMTSTDDAERRYRLLSEPDAVERAQYTESQLKSLLKLISTTVPQTEDWPKGMSWN